METNPKVFSIKGKGLKLDSRADIAEQLGNVNAAIIEEVHFGGNTIGVDAALELADFLEMAKCLKVGEFRSNIGDG